MADKNRESVKGVRADLSILSHIAQKGETENISKKKQRIKRKYRITTSQELQTTVESLKMKIQAKAHQVRRYVKRSKQYKQNLMFANNRKTLFRNLGKDQILVETNHQIKKQQKHFDVTSGRTIESTTIQRSG